MENTNNTQEWVIDKPDFNSDIKKNMCQIF